MKIHYISYFILSLMISATFSEAIAGTGAQGSKCTVGSDCASHTCVCSHNVIGSAGGCDGNGLSSK